MPLRQHISLILHWTDAAPLLKASGMLPNLNYSVTLWNSTYFLKEQWPWMWEVQTLRNPKEVNATRTYCWVQRQVPAETRCIYRAENALTELFCFCADSLPKDTRRNLQLLQKQQPHGRTTVEDAYYTHPDHYTWVSWPPHNCTTPYNPGKTLPKPPSPPSAQAAYGTSSTKWLQSQDPPLGAGAAEGCSVASHCIKG